MTRNSVEDWIEQAVDAFSAQKNFAHRVRLAALRAGEDHV